MRRGLLLGIAIGVMLVVVGFVAVIGASLVATGAALERVSQAMVDTASLEVRRLDDRVQIWQLRHPGVPGSLDDVSDEPGMADPWGSRYRMEVVGDTVTVVSDGPDRTPGTEDDIRSDRVR